MMEGRTVGHYRIIEQLGSGGMGIVYKAHDSKLDRTVALKFLPPHLSADETSKQRFIQEARAASALDHANICTIHDINEDDDGKLFIVMSFYDGQTLKYLLEEGPLSTEHALMIAHQIAAGLARAHEAGMVHRDIKPANIMVTDRGEVKILDFGIAKLSESIDLTKTGSTVGTAAYMSPEQAKGEAVDVRADIWSVGILLYEMLSGKKPFDGTYEAALIYSIVNAAHEPITTPLPDGVQEIVDRCLAKDPDSRFSGGVELVHALSVYTQSSGSGVAIPAATEAAQGALYSNERTESSSTAASTSRSGTRSAADLTRSVGLVLGGFIGVSLLVLALIYFGMIQFGLPDWVFPAGVVLMIMGLPVILYAARKEARLEASWLTLRRASMGGVLAVTGLAAFSALFMIMRSAGIGPAASLQSSGALDENAQLLIADFENRTEDARIAESVTEALKIDLSQSTVINLMDDSQLVSVLARMNKAPDAVIDIDMAMEIAAREGAEAVVAGEVSALGAGFIVSARLIAAHNGEELVALRENARDDSEVIEAVDQLSARLRERIGESIKLIRSNEDLEKVTTSSLDALRLFSEGSNFELAGDFPNAVARFEQAIEIDPEFAMAYRKLSVIYANSGQPAQSTQTATQAYELRENLPDRERGLTTAYYHMQVTVDPDLVIDAYENVLSKYPDETVALNNVAVIYNLIGRHDLAESRTRRAAELGSAIVYYNNLLQSLTSQGKSGAADSALTRLLSVQPDHPFTRLLQGVTQLDLGRLEAADTVLMQMPAVADPMWNQYRIRFSGLHDAMRGRLATAESKLQEAERIAGEVRSQPALENALFQAELALEVEGSASKALSILNEALSNYPLDSLDTLNRPYDTVIALYARAGDLARAKQVQEDYDRELDAASRYRKLALGSQYIGTAELLAAEGDIESAITEYLNFYDRTGCQYCFVSRQARLLETAGRLEEAIALYERASTMAYGNDLFGFIHLRPLAYYQLGELYSRVGRTDDAIEAYSRFAEFWTDADEPLQERVRYANNRIDQLLKQAAREPQ